MKIKRNIRLQRHRGRWLAIVDDDKAVADRGTNLMRLHDFDEEMPAWMVAEEMRRRHPRARVDYDTPHYHGEN